MVSKDQLLKYDPAMDMLSEKSMALLSQAVDSTQDFVKVSPQLSNTSYRTRGAHAKSYVYVNAQFEPNIELVKDLGLQEHLKENQSLLIRFSNANNVIYPESKNFPAYGMSLQWENSMSYPLVNFPLFPTDDVDSFLQLFIDLNQARIAQALHGWGAIKELPSVLLSTFKAMYHINPLHLGNVMWKGVQMQKDFVLNYAYHGIGCYRFGEYVGKLHTEKLNFEFKDNEQEKAQKTTLQQVLNKESIQFKLYIQLAVNEKETPVNILSKEWSQEVSPYLELGKISIPMQKVIESNPSLEATTFNPFQNPKELQPVGRIQQTRKVVYEIAYQTRKNSI